MSDQIRKRVTELPAVIVGLHHFLDPFQAQGILIWKPLCIQNFIRWHSFINQSVIVSLLFHIRTLQYFQKTKLQLLRFQCINIIKGFSKAFIIFIRQSCDQIQVLMYITIRIDSPYHFCNLFKFHCPVNLTYRIQVGRLHTDFQLDQPWPHGFYQFHFFFIQKVCRNLKMEIGNAVIMLFDITPDCHGVIMFAVKCTVYKFNLRYFMIDKKLQFFFYQFQITEPQTLIYRRKTITARKWTSTACLIINNLMFKKLHVLIYKRNLTQIHGLAPFIFHNLPGLFPVYDSFHILKSVRCLLLIKV